jgi:hypothetical protein
VNDDSPKKVCELIRYTITCFEAEFISRTIRCSLSCGTVTSERINSSLPTLSMPGIRSRPQLHGVVARGCRPKVRKGTREWRRYVVTPWSSTPLDNYNIFEQGTIPTPSLERCSDSLRVTKQGVCDGDGHGLLSRRPVRRRGHVRGSALRVARQRIQGPHCCPAAALMHACDTFGSLKLGWLAETSIKHWRGSSWHEKPPSDSTMSKSPHV